MRGQVFETLSLAKQEHSRFFQMCLWGSFGALGRVWLGSQLLLPTRLVLSSNPKADVSAWDPGLRIKLAGL